MQQTERRAHTRAPLRARATVTTGRGDLPAEVFDLSVGGLGLRMVDSMSAGEFIRVRVQLPTERGPAWFDPDAVVSRVHRGSGEDTVGICFVSPSPKLQQVLAARVSDHINGRGRRKAERPETKPEPNSKLELAALFRSAVEDVDGSYKKR